MADGFKSTGGVRIGWINASWPLAELSVSPGALKLRTLIGTYTFTPEQVVRIEPYGSIPILYRGIRIVHSNPDCPSSVIFWCLRNPERLIERIRQAIPGASPLGAQARRGVPFRWSFILALVAVWNALFILDGFVPGQSPSKSPGPLVLLGLASCSSRRSRWSGRQPFNDGS
jgi:hypothetical protein